MTDLEARLAEAANVLQATATGVASTSSATVEPRVIIETPLYHNSDATFGTPQNIPSSENITELESSQRFSGAIWYNKVREQVITLAGVGGIGSYVVYLLSRMKPESIRLYDPDIVEYVNLAGQLYSRNHIGMQKVSAMDSLAQQFSEYYGVQPLPERFTSDSIATDIMICGFDNMAARKTFFDAWKRRVDSTDVSLRHKMLFIDGRLNAEEFQVLCLTGNNQYAIDKYESGWLFDDSEVEDTVCSYKQTTYMANMIGSIMVNLFVNFCANLCNPLIERDVPFLTRYDGSTMFFKTE